MKRSFIVLAAVLTVASAFVVTGVVSAHAPITYMEWDTDTNPSRLIAKTNKREMVAEPGSYRPLAPTALYLSNKEWRAAVEERPIHLATPFPQPGSDTVIEFGVEGPRDFAPERAQNANVYEAVVKHVAKLRKGEKKVVLASYTAGARERLA